MQTNYKKNSKPQPSFGPMVAGARSGFDKVSNKVSNKVRGVGAMALGKKMGLAALLLLGVGQATAHAESGWFLRPEVEMTFADPQFTRGSGKIGLGGGLSFGFGYQYDAWQWETNVAWHYLGGKNLRQVIGGKNQLANVGESSIPIYTGVNYTFPFLQSIDTTIGLGAGVMIYGVNKTFALDSTFADKTTVVRGLLVPKIELDYAITDNLTLTLGGKFYLVFNGYNEVYSPAARAAVAATGAKIGSDKLLWYGSLALGTSYRF